MATDILQTTSVSPVAASLENDDMTPPEQPDVNVDEITRSWNHVMQSLYAVRDLAHLLDVADDRAETLGYVIEREAERGVEHMNQLERLLWEARK